MNQNIGQYPIQEIKTIKEMLINGAENYSDKPAFLVKEEKGGPYKEVSYKKVLRDVNALGTKLLDMGLSGARIAIIGDNSYEWILAYFAVVCGVGTVVPLDKELKLHEIQNLVDAAECSAIFYASSYEKKIENLDIPLRLKFEVYRNEEIPYAANDMSQLIYEGRKLMALGDTRYRECILDPEKSQHLSVHIGNHRNTESRYDIAQEYRIESYEYQQDCADFF